MDYKHVQVKSSLKSVTNWAQFAGLIGMLLTLFKLDGVITSDQVIQVLAGIQAVVSVFTIIWKSFFSNTITAASAAKI